MKIKRSQQSYKKTTKTPLGLLVWLSGLTQGEKLPTITTPGLTDSWRQSLTRTFRSSTPPSSNNRRYQDTNLLSDHNPTGYRLPGQQGLKKIGKKKSLIFPGYSPHRPQVLMQLKQTVNLRERRINQTDTDKSLILGLLIKLIIRSFTRSFNNLPKNSH